MKNQVVKIVLPAQIQLLTFDEGGLGTQILNGSKCVLPSTDEGSYACIFINLKTEGGYSSAPPKTYNYFI